MKTNGIMHTPTNITFLYILFFNLRCRCWAQKWYNSECVIAYISGQYYPVLNYSENLHTSRCVVYNIESRNRCLKRTWFHSPDRERNFRLHVPVSLMYKTIRKCQGSKVSVTATLRGHFNVTTELATLRTYKLLHTNWPCNCDLPWLEWWVRQNSEFRFVLHRRRNIWAASQILICRFIAETQFLLSIITAPTRRVQSWCFCGRSRKWARNMFLILP